MTSMCERASDYALGSLGEEDARAYRAHLMVCQECVREVESLRRVLDPVAGLAPAAAPPEGLKQRLLERVRADRRAQVWKAWESDANPTGLTLLPRSEERWEATGVAGVEVRRLHVDRAADRATMLVRMAPGSSYPSHRHAGAEECYVIEGDLLVHGHRMVAGDYQRASGGSLHGVQSTETGCLLLIVSSLHDELLDSHP
jgi:anti-sigma factor ChrR (cupin superfamily)